MNSSTDYRDLFGEKFQRSRSRLEARVRTLYKEAQTDAVPLQRRESGPNRIFSVHSKRLLRLILLTAAIVYSIYGILFTFLGTSYLPPILSLAAAVIFHAAYWTLRENRVPRWTSVPMALLGGAVSVINLILCHRLQITIFHYAFLLPLLLVYLCAVPDALRVSILFLILYATVLFLPPSPDHILNDIPILNRVLFLAVYTINIASAYISRRWFFKVYSDYAAIRSTLLEVIRLQEEGITITSHAIRNELNTLAALENIISQRPQTAQNLDEYTSISRTLLKNMTNISSGIEGMRLSIDDDPDLPPDPNTNAQDRHIFPLHRTVAQRVLTNLKLREIAMVTQEHFDAQIPEQVEGDPQRLHDGIDRMIGEALRSFLNEDHELHVATHYMGQLQDGKIQILLSLRATAIVTKSSDPTHSENSEAIPTSDYGDRLRHLATRIPMNVPTLLQLENGIACLYRFTVREYSGIQHPRVALHDPQSRKERWEGNPEAILKQATLLLVEDNIINQRLMRLILEDKVHRIDLAENGTQALKMAQGEHYDLILMDIQLPNLDGYEVTRRIRASEEKERHELDYSIPILAITAYGLPAEREIALKAGMNDYISKPFNTQQLLETAAQLIHGSREKAGLP